MCTVTWNAFSGGYDLFMNRDELYSRSEALPPVRHTAAGVSFLAPVDGDAGGSWIAVNQFGLTVCLLNHYPQSDSAATDYRSRGRLVTDLAVAATANDVTAALARMDLSAYRPFTLFLMGAGSVPRTHRWNGSGFLETVDAPAPPLSSSSFDGEVVVATRTAAYSELVGDQPSATLLDRYHRSHLPERGPYSVCTHREDGGSRSLTRISVDEHAIVMGYAAGPPCEAGAVADPTVRIARVARVG